VVAGSATLHHQIAGQYAPSDTLPCADAALLLPLKRSAEYAGIRRRTASPRAVDSWQDEGLHFFVFQLMPAEGDALVPDDPPVAVFTMHPDEAAPLAAVIVTPQPGGSEATITDLRAPERSYTAPLLE
jgi:hypothetical protein